MRILLRTSSARGLNHLDEVEPAASDDGLLLRSLARFKDGLPEFVVLFAAENGGG
jgi:hypothetical protein